MTDPAVPVTKAGRTLVAEHGRKFRSQTHLTRHILAIEAEAAQAAEQRVAELEKALDRWRDWITTKGDPDYEDELLLQALSDTEAGK
jgi:hypothetical protein